MLLLACWSFGLVLQDSISGQILTTTFNHLLFNSNDSTTIWFIVVMCIYQVAGILKYLKERWDGYPFFPCCMTHLKVVLAKNKLIIIKKNTYHKYLTSHSCKSLRSTKSQSYLHTSMKLTKYYLLWLIWITNTVEDT